ncbi:sugar phosphate isomerase/epimerase family protein [Rhizobium mongolense]|uniref:Sugar phosphate isomerase/epimerase n=2 Tax=Rhizobium mongolense TaxID=57676 RepID=A0ABR6IZD9_9HYPH|nr:sugar phosphate isomerase/epimerase family protein [Rhizobium mongolense]MBB4233289.1 sugar phosphate isomerase/epimerase [Rhizobium mongolense]TVZ75145.1 sugar phosphate isomerase/epimerase [Rhizobium mongolense USDA 1844]
MKSPYSMSGIADEAASSIAVQIATHKAIGLSHIELRSVDGSPIDALGKSEVSALIARIKQADFVVDCLDSRIGNWSRTVEYPLDDELAEIDRLANICHALGCKSVRIMSYSRGTFSAHDWQERAIERLFVFVNRAKEHGIMLLHENCDGFAGRSPSDTLRMLRLVDSTNLRLLFDTGNGLAYGYDALAFLRPIVDFVDHVHIKDGMKSGGEVTYCRAGCGHAGVAACLALLFSSGYRGVFSIEPHLAVLPHAGRADPENDRRIGLYTECAVSAGDLVRDVWHGITQHV